MKYFFTVGINKYNSASFGGQKIDLNQCVNDALRAYNSIGLACDQRQLLEDENATKSEILANLEYYSKKVQPGDLFIYHQSSHGTLWYENNGSATTARLAHDGVIPDWQMAQVWAKFPAGVTIVTLSDLCHAESSQRELMPNTSELKARYMEYRGAITPKPTDLKITYLANLWHVSACKFDQVSWEDSKGGVFTTLLLKVINDTPVSKSINVILKDLKKIIQKQDPVLERIGKGKVPKL